jgi:hypothetical protein
MGCGGSISLFQIKYKGVVLGQYELEQYNINVGHLNLKVRLIMSFESGNKTNHVIMYNSLSVDMLP